MAVGVGLAGQKYRKPKSEGVFKPANQGAATFYGSQARAAVNSAPQYGGPGSTQQSNYFGDPAYELAKAFSARSRTEAQATAKRKREQAAIMFGDAGGADVGADVASQAANNPFSVLKNLQYGYNQGVTGLEDELNKANLFYSGYRGEQLGNAAHQYQQAQADARNQYQGLQSDIGDQLSAALMQADYMEQMAALNAGAGSFPGGQPPQQPAPVTYDPSHPVPIAHPWAGQDPNAVYHPYLSRRFY